MSDPHTLSYSQIQVLQAISNGYTTPAAISGTLRISEDDIETSLAELERTNYVIRNSFRRNYLLTTNGANVIAAHMPSHVPANSRVQINRSEVRHTTNVRTGFSVTFGGIMGIFAALLAISMIASVVIWLGYHFVLKDMIPTSLLPYVPLDNFLFDFVLSLIGTLSIFLPLRRSGLGFLGRLFR